MQKFFVTILIIMSTCISANATTFVKYNMAGSPVSVQRGWHAPVSMKTAERTYTQRGRYMYNNRPINPYNYRRTPYSMQQTGRIVNYNYPTQSIAPSTRPISRFNKNYSITPRRSYVTNGVRYYN